jgi:hypothetical protein
MKQFLLALSSVFSLSLYSSPAWVPYTGVLPPSAKWVGLEEVRPDKSIQDFSICRGEYKEEFLPGRTSQNECLITYKGDVIRLKVFEVLLHNNSVRFIKVKGNAVHKKALTAGGTISDIKYICSTLYKNLWYAGRLEDSGCKIGYKDKEVSVNDKVYVLVKTKD